MTYDLKPYPIYKDSGVAWLGQVPEYWEVLPTRALFAEVNEREHPDEEMLSVTITQGVIRQRTLLEGSSKKDSSNQDRSAYKLVCAGDIAYNKMRAWQGAIGVSAFRGIVSPAYVVVRLRQDNNGRYFHHLFRTPQFAKEAERWSYGITSDMWSLRPEHFRMIYSPLPPREEQDAIVRYLDHVDRRIRRYIRAKQKLIKLLEEQRQVIIHRAVTRGLNPNARLKPSGVEWLGDVPEHWKIVPLKRVAWFKGGSGFPVHEQGAAGLEIPFLKVSDMNLEGNERRMEVATNTVTRETAARLGAYVFPADAVIFPKVGGALLTNKRRLLTSPSCIDNNMMGCVILDGKRDYMFILLDWLDFGRLAKPGPVPAISEGEVREIKVALPPIGEQEVILERVKEETRPYTLAITVGQREIELAREYHTRLIADVATGKLDVREAAARLPEEAEEGALEEASEIAREEEVLEVAEGEESLKEAEV